MKLIVLILSLWLLIVNPCFSQETYKKQTDCLPKLEVQSFCHSNKDTTVTLLIEQVRDINLIFEALRYELNLNDSLKMIIIEQEELRDLLISKIKLLLEMTYKQEEMIDHQHELIELDEKENRDLKRQNKAVKITRNFAIPISFGLGIYLGYIITK